MKTIIAEDVVLMCKKHGKPITPGNIRQRYKHCGCTKCNAEARIRGMETRKKRWDYHLLKGCLCDSCSCARHPKKRCARSRYIISGGRRCNYCSARLSNMNLRPCKKRYYHWYDLRKSAKKSLQNREFALTQGFDPTTGGNIHSV